MNLSCIKDCGILIFASECLILVKLIRSAFVGNCIIVEGGSLYCRLLITEKKTLIRRIAQLLIILKEFEIEPRV